MGLLLAALAVLIGRGLLDGEGALPKEVRITGVPDTFRITYEVHGAAGPDGGETVTTEVLEVDRPFRSLAVTREGSPPGGRIVTGRISDLNRLLLFNDGSWNELQLAPALAASDLRLDGVLDRLVDSGDVQRRDEVRRIAGRACEVFRLGGPIGGGGIVPVGSAANEHADICVDEDGLVLLEAWEKDGKVLRRRTAVDVAVDVTFADDTFTVEDADPVSATSGGGSARRVTDDSPFGARTWNLPRPPVGFRHVGRWAVIWPRLDSSIDPFAGAESGRIAGIATVWVSGPDVLVVEQGASADGARPFDAHPQGENVDLGALDAGEVVTDGRGTEVRVSYVDGTYVRVWSTLPRNDVIELARTLEPGPGGEPVFVK